MSNTTNRVRFRHWVWLTVLTLAVWVLAFSYAEKSEGAEYGDLGYITEGTNLCHTDNITPHTIARLLRWGALIERLDAAGGVIFLSAEDNDLGSTLSEWCNTLSEGYPVVLYHIDGEYALMVWEKSLGFGSYTFIIKLYDFQSGGLRL